MGIYSNYILDASALLALINREDGAKDVEKILPGAIMSAVNISEAAAVMHRLGMPMLEIKEIFINLIPERVPFDTEQAFHVARLRKDTKHKGLSLGDRACLALGIIKKIPVLTADKIWMNLNLDLEIVCIR